MNKLKGEKLNQWLDKNERINHDKILKVGMEVIDCYGDKGIVVKIVKDEDTVDSDGCVYIWQSERTDYGSDNCMHYALNIWKRELRILNEP